LLTISASYKKNSKEFELVLVPFMGSGAIGGVK